MNVSEVWSSFIYAGLGRNNIFLAEVERDLQSRWGGGGGKKKQRREIGNREKVHLDSLLKWA